VKVEFHPAADSELGAAAKSPQAAGILDAAKVMCQECDELRLGVP